MKVRSGLPGFSFWLRFSRFRSAVRLVKEQNSSKTWERTRLQNLLRHKSGRYYSRAFAGGKEVWKSLKTSHFSVAQARLAEFLKEHRHRWGNNGNGEVSAKMTFGEPGALHRALSSANGSTHFLSYRDAAKAVPGMSHQEAHDITRALQRCGVIAIEDKGKAGSNSPKAAEFRYLLPLIESPVNSEDGGGLDL